MRDKLLLFRQRVLEKNAQLNLTAIRDEEEFERKNIADSLKLLEFHTFHPGDRVLDLGTGAGLPGIPLAIARGDVRFTLLDARQKKIRFLNELIRTLGLSNVQAVAGRAEELGRESGFREQYDAVVTRALAPLNILLEYAVPFLKTGGMLIAYKGPKGAQELQEAQNALKRLHTELTAVYEYELEPEKLRLMLFRKRKKTSPEFPRSPGTPSRKPL